MNIARFPAIICGILIGSTAAALAQAPPPVNPVLPSLTGTNAEQVIYREVSISTSDLLTGAIQFKEDAESAKAVFAPFKLSQTYRPVLTDIGINIAQKKGVTTLGLGAGYSSKYPTSATAQKQLAAKLATLKTFRSQTPGESASEYEMLYEAFYKDLWADIYHDFYSSLAKNLWVVSASWNRMIFGLGGDPIDADEDDEVDNAHDSKGHDLAFTFTYTFSQATGITYSRHTGERRIDAKANSEMADYDGWSLSFVQRVKILNPNYKKSSDYLKSLFIPAILAGVSFESETCDGTAASCQDRLIKREAYTPFVDFKIAPEAQFRIGVPIQKSTVFGGKSKTQLGASMQYVLQLKGIK
jgi:hypothetical protein